MRSLASSSACLVLGGLLSACGSNRPELPAGFELSVGCSAPDYPLGPYGTEPGSVVKNACFPGLRDPARSGRTESELEALSLADFYDPSGERYAVLLLNTAAVWCSACRVEHEDLSGRLANLSGRKLGVLGALFQDRDRNPAQFSDLALWTETFATPFPMALDPSYQLGVYASAETAPLNLVIDTRDMRILQKYIGDQAEVLWPYLDSILPGSAASANP
ncbi:MAG TPA: hypothetical protein VFQ61_11035 [Polyangiaceae bacterium]|nr:hypothetical protein [Polyangiaceae bacterium]